MKGPTSVAGWTGWLTGAEQAHELGLVPRTWCLELNTDAVFSWFATSVLEMRYSLVLLGLQNGSSLLQLDC